MLQIGQVQRVDNRINFMRGDWGYPLLVMDLRLAIDSYGHLIGKGETIKTGEWISHIVKSYSKSKRRDAMIKALCIASRTKQPEIVKC